MVCSRLPGVCVRDPKLRDGRHAQLICPDFILQLDPSLAVRMSSRWGPSGVDPLNAMPRLNQTTLHIERFEGGVKPVLCSGGLRSELSRHVRVGEGHRMPPSQPASHAARLVVQLHPRRWCRRGAGAGRSVGAGDLPRPWRSGQFMVHVLSREPFLRRSERSMRHGQCAAPAPGLSRAMSHPQEGADRIEHPPHRAMPSI